MHEQKGEMRVMWGGNGPGAHLLQLQADAAQGLSLQLPPRQLAHLLLPSLLRRRADRRRRRLALRRRRRRGRLRQQ